MNLQADCTLPATAPSFSVNRAGEGVRPAILPLVLAAQSGCPVAFNKLSELYSHRVYRTLLSITKHPEDAEDALQDTFLRAFVAIRSFEGRANFYTWLTRIAVNAALGVLRKRRRRSEMSLDAASPGEGEEFYDTFSDNAPNPEQIYAAHEARIRLTQAVQKLPPQLRRATQIHLAGDFSVKEVARQLNLSEAATKARLHRARIILSAKAA